MLIKLTRKQLPKIKNPVFLKYAQMYQSIYDNFLAQIKSTGIELADKNVLQTEEILKRLRGKKAVFRNNEKSIYVNWLSPACEACKTGEGSITLYLSLMCNRNCFFCFNSNQESFEHYTRNKRDCLQELTDLAQRNEPVSHLALSGGEPLLHKKETGKFFRTCREKFPAAHTRLYTSGDFVDHTVLKELNNCGLKEIRFSIKMEDPPDFRQAIYKKITLAKKYIPDVVVEMPVMPGMMAEMKSLLVDLDKIGIKGINLLEFCFPYSNVQEFNNRGYKVKNPPFEVLYDYWYAGGLPIWASE